MNTDVGTVPWGYLYCNMCVIWVRNTSCRDLDPGLLGQLPTYRMKKYANHDQTSNQILSFLIIVHQKLIFR
jgi:hypothetical protein